MSTLKYRTHSVRIIAILMAWVFLFTSIPAFAIDAPQKSCLAPELSTSQPSWQDRFLAGEILLSHRAQNAYIHHQIELLKKEKGQAWLEERIKEGIIPIPGLLINTAQLAHLGLGRNYDRPMIYMDADLYLIESDKMKVFRHEAKEKAGWEEVRVALNSVLTDKLEPRDMRARIKLYIDIPDPDLQKAPGFAYLNLSYRQIAKKIHEKAESEEPMEDLYAKYAPQINIVPEYLTSIMSSYTPLSEDNDPLFYDENTTTDVPISAANRAAILEAPDAIQESVVLPENYGIISEIFARDYRDRSSGKTGLAVLEKQLPYLASSGVEYLYISDLLENTAVNGIRDVSPLAGTTKDLKQFIARAHSPRLKLKIMIGIREDDIKTAKFLSRIGVDGFYLINLKSDPVAGKEFVDAVRLENPDCAIVFTNYVDGQNASSKTDNLNYRMDSLFVRDALANVLKGSAMPGSIAGYLMELQDAPDEVRQNLVHIAPEDQTLSEADMRIVHFLYAMIPGRKIMANPEVYGASGRYRESRVAMASLYEDVDPAKRNLRESILSLSKKYRQLTTGQYHYITTDAPQNAMAVARVDDKGTIVIGAFNVTENEGFANLSFESELRSQINAPDTYIKESMQLRRDGTWVAVEPQVVSGEELLNQFGVNVGPKGCEIIRLTNTLNVEKQNEASAAAVTSVTPEVIEDRELADAAIPVVEEHYDGGTIYSVAVRDSGLNEIRKQLLRLHNSGIEYVYLSGLLKDNASVGTLSVDERAGTLADFSNFMAQAKNVGIKVIVGMNSYDIETAKLLMDEGVDGFRMEESARGVDLREAFIKDVRDSNPDIYLMFADLLGQEELLNISGNRKCGVDNCWLADKMAHALVGRRVGFLDQYIEILRKLPKDSQKNTIYLGMEGPELLSESDRNMLYLLYSFMPGYHMIPSSENKGDSRQRVFSLPIKYKQLRSGEFYHPNSSVPDNAIAVARADREGMVIGAFNVTNNDDWTTLDIADIVHSQIDSSEIGSTVYIKESMRLTSDGKWVTLEEQEITALNLLSGFKVKVPSKAFEVIRLRKKTENRGPAVENRGKGSPAEGLRYFYDHEIDSQSSVTKQQFATARGYSLTTVGHELDALESLGLINVDRIGRVTRYYLADNILLVRRDVIEKICNTVEELNHFKVYDNEFPKVSEEVQNILKEAGLDRRADSGIVGKVDVVLEATSELLRTELVPTNLTSHMKYEIRYDKNATRDCPYGDKIIKAYVTLLKSRTGDNDKGKNITLTPTNGEDGLISIASSVDGTPFGKGVVNFADREVINDIRLLDMLNMAFAAANIKKTKIDGAEAMDGGDNALLEYIKNVCNRLYGAGVPTIDGILKFIANLPKITAERIDDLAAYNRLTLVKLHQSA